MATAESHRDRVARLRAQLDRMPDPNIQSGEELDRQESARAARHFGFAQPAFRTSVKVRFSGDGVTGHDLLAATAGLVVNGFADVVDAAAQDVKMPKGSTPLYLSPIVTAGSAVLELFGPEPAKPDQEKLDTEIDDGPVDAALRRVFSLLDTVNLKNVARLPESDLEMTPGLANKLFGLSNNLLETDIDLGLVWTRPRGSQREAAFSRSTAHHFRALLDSERTSRLSMIEVGLLSHISTDGSIGFTFGEKRDKTVTLDASGVDAERLRSLWATDVRVSWVEETTSHPKRGVRPQVVRTFIDVAPVFKPQS